MVAPQIGKMGLQMGSLNGNPLASNLLNPAGDENGNGDDGDGDDGDGDDGDGDDDNDDDGDGDGGDDGDGDGEREQGCWGGLKMHEVGGS